MTRQRKARRQPGKGRDTSNGAKFALALYDSPTGADCQLSVDSLTRAGYLHGDLGLFFLARLPGIEHLPDPRFTPLFRQALDCFDREAELLKRAGDLEQREAGQ